ncbi:MAG: hypothetical protein M4579_006175 [Chaenotheca gracillima]|nr:MAG: hypothetical protein M4579_006175 [Chaenotheca gracillima]
MAYQPILGTNPTGLVVPPHRVTKKSYRDDRDPRPSDTEEFVFCHNDLNMGNITVDPESLKINAIINWEYAGFYPEYFERRLLERPGQTVASSVDEDDSQKLLEYLQSRQKT